MTHIPEIWGRVILDLAATKGPAERILGAAGARTTRKPELVWGHPPTSITVDLGDLGTASCDAAVLFKSCVVGTFGLCVILVYEQVDGFYILGPDPDARACVRGPFETMAVAQEMAEVFLKMENVNG